MKRRGTIAALCIGMRWSTMAAVLVSASFAAPAFAEGERTPPPEEKRDGMRLGLDLSFARSNGEAPDRVSEHSPSMIPLGAALSFRTSAKVLVGVHGHFGLASRDDCLGDSGCAARTYGLGAHIEAAFVSHGVFIPYIRYGVGWEMLHQKGMFKNADGYRYSHGLDLIDFRFGGDFRLSPRARLGPFIGMIAGVGLHEDRAPAAERSLDSGHMWFSIGARGTFDL